MRRKNFFAPSLAVILSGLLFAVPASAITIDDIHDDFTITWFLAQGGQITTEVGLPHLISRRTPLLTLPLFPPLP